MCFKDSLFRVRSGNGLENSVILKLMKVKNNSNSLVDEELREVVGVLFKT